MITKQARLGILLGNVLHHYETSLFGWAAPFLAPVFFPDKSAQEGLLFMFALFPLNALSKPLGAIFWGRLGDRYGRKATLITTLLGTSLATFAIGCIPATPNIWMFIALLRILQGFFSAGEEKGAALFLLEQTHPKQRTWMSALYDASGILGIFLASLLTALLAAEHWRFLFYLAALTGLLAVFLRSAAKESPQTPAPFSWKFVWQARAPLLRIVTVCGFSYANYYFLSVFLNGILPQISGISKEEALLINSHLLYFDLALLLLFGFCCRYVAKERLMAVGALLAAVTAIPLLLLLPTASFLGIFAIRLAFVIFGTLLAAPYHAWKFEQLPEQHRFFLTSFASTLGAKLFGSPTPLLSAYLFAQTGSLWTAALPVCVLGIASCLVLLPRTQEKTYRIATPKLPV